MRQERRDNLESLSERLLYWPSNDLSVFIYRFFNSFEIAELWRCEAIRFLNGKGKSDLAQINKVAF